MGYKIVRAILDFFFFIVFRLHVEGRENVPEKGAIIVAPNHKSYWDPPMIGVAFKTRIVHFMAKEELFKNPVFGWVIRQLGTFPVRRGVTDRAAIRQAVKVLKGRGGCLLANHGVLAIGDTLERAFVRAGYVENAAKICSIAMSNGTIVPLGEELCEAVRAHYGVKI